MKPDEFQLYICFIMLSDIFVICFVCIWCNAYRSLSMYVDYPVGCYVYRTLPVQSLPKPKPELSTILLLVFVAPRVLRRGRACRLFKDNSKLLFLLIKWLWKRVKIKHLLNVDHTSHFVTTFLFCLQCLLVFFTVRYFFCLWGFFCLYKSELTKVLYYIFLPTCVSVWANDCFCYCSWRGSVGGYVLRTGAYGLLSVCGAESTWTLLCSIQSL